ncbi:unknown [Cercopithecine alphaherpesvirus 9]|uniref:Uncharacterized protein n=1 Tax=Cercopithecine herpesvirus 9 (strain DHV) TaxID=36348 RepID=Q9E1Z1_CHV9D|nr:DNA packaging protein UL33 [Cercopithecine alphaherpesvirus 9]AAG27198.1 unknown [Cercopithecine alphaherpesvirus 9]
MYSSENASDNHPDPSTVLEKTSCSNSSIFINGNQNCVKMAVRVKDIIPNEDLQTLDLNALEAKYLSDEQVQIAIWFDNLIPPEMEAVFPTTDSQVNYISFTDRFSSMLKHGFVNNMHTDASICAHRQNITHKRERFSSIMGKFLDLHQILKES